MYHRYFGLSEPPFSIAVDPRYLFMSERHRDALAHLLYGVGAGGGFILLTGEVGTGKTTINRCLLEQLPKKTDIALVLNPALNAVELLATVCDELNIPYTPGEQSLKTLSDKLHQFLLSNHSNGRKTVLLIDEAQHLQFDVLEQIRLLTNLETNTQKLLQIILVGQPELRKLLARPDLRQLSQRITARYQLQPLTLEETEAYIRHRLKVAEFPEGQTLFPRAIVKRIHKTSRGIPRIINTLCDRMLLGAYGQQKTQVTRPLFKQAVKEVLGEDHSETATSSSPLKWATAFSLLLSIGIVLWLVAIPGNFIKPGASGQEQVHITPPLPANQQPVEIASLPDVANEPEPETQPQTPALAESLLAEESQALNILAKWANHTLPCEEKGMFSRCERLTANSWQELADFNRPVVLTLFTPANEKRYAVLVGLTDDSVQLLHNDSPYRYSHAELNPLWNGEFILAWQPPTGYTVPFSLATVGYEVEWLAKQFAILDGQDKQLAQRRFNQPLFERVKIFQASHGLEPDGVVGFNTLIKVNEQRGIAKTLVTELPEAPESVVGAK